MGDVCHLDPGAECVMNVFWILGREGDESLLDPTERERSVIWINRGVINVF